MRGYGSVWSKTGLMLGIAALAAFTHPAQSLASDMATASGVPKLEQKIGSIPMFRTAPPQLCTRAVSVCARELQPLGVEIGGTFTVKIERHYRSTYSCAIVNGKPAWVVISTEGSCEAQPVITLPAKYDDDEAWNVG